MNVEKKKKTSDIEHIGRESAVFPRNTTFSSAVKFKSPLFGIAHSYFFWLGTASCIRIEFFRGGRHRLTSALKLTTFPRVVIRGAKSEIDLNITTHLLLRRERTSAEEKTKAQPRQDGWTLSAASPVSANANSGNRAAAGVSVGYGFSRLSPCERRKTGKLFVRAEYLFSDAYSNRWIRAANES